MKKNQAGFTVVEVLLSVIAVAIVGFVIFYVVNANKDNKRSDNTSSQSSQNNVTDSKKSETVDKTADWKAYTNESLKFSLKYPASWKASSGEGCNEDDGFYRGATEAGSGTCDKQSVSQISVVSYEGDKRSDFAFNDKSSVDVQSSDVTIDGNSGKRYSYINQDHQFYADGSKGIDYIFFANNRTYIASYNDGLGKYTDATSDFDTMISKTLKFTP